MQKWLSLLVLITVLVCSRLSIVTQASAVPPSQTLTQGVDSKESEIDALQPSPELSPADVVRIQIEALGRNDTPHENAGIEITFRFASPANKIATGPLERFIQLVRNPEYRSMLNHRGAQYGEMQVEDNRAVQPVLLTAENGERVGYVFFLSKQRGGPHDACWMTDGVTRFAVPPEHHKPLPTI